VILTFTTALAELDVRRNLLTALDSQQRVVRSQIEALEQKVRFHLYRSLREPWCEKTIYLS